MRSVTTYIKLLLICLTFGLASASYAQKISSTSFGNTFIHHEAELVIHGYHNFDVGSLQALPGIIGTERRQPRGYIGFTENSEVVGANNKAHVDGYIRFHGAGIFILPLGDNGVYAPLRAEQKSGTLGAGYYKADAAVGVTSILNGDSYPALPEGGPYDTKNHGPDITNISDIEYWHIEGDSEARISLYYNKESGLDRLATGNPANLSIVGWNGTSWDIIPSKVESSTLGSSLDEGSIVTNDLISPTEYSILTFASLSNEELTPGNISGIAWSDLNGDGIKQNNEPVLTKIELVLEECDPTKSLITITTDNDGFYNFGDLADGHYRITINKEDLGQGYDISIIPGLDGGINNDFDRSGATECKEIKYGTEYNSVNIGIVELSSIGDFVWDDLNQNGLQDNGEPGIAGVELLLMQEDSVISITDTDAAGHYAFNDVYPGDYYILAATVSEREFTQNANNNNRNSDVDYSNGPQSTYTFNISPGENNPNIDIGYAVCSTISDFVFIDRDKNNIYNEGDFKKENIEVNLYRESNNGYVHYQNTITDADGKYEFCVSPGKYYVEFILPYGLYEFATPFVGDNDQIDSNVDGSNGQGTTPSFTFDGTSELSGIGAGLHSEDFVGTMVWLDLNRDGLRQISEPGIEGIKVDLYNSNHLLQTSKTSDEEGRITFSQLEEGMYYMRATELGEYEITLAFAGSDRTIDNNFNEANGKYSSASFEVIKGYSNPNIDLGLMNEECLFTPLAYDLRMGINGIDVIWETGFESLISHYVVEKQVGTDEYEALKSYSPNGKEHQIYGYKDKDYDKGTVVSYRILAIALDGTVCISEMRSINVPESDVVINVLDDKEFDINPNQLDNECDIAPQKVYHKMIDDQPQVIWITESEENISHFIVQRKLRISDRYIGVDTIMSDRQSNQIYAEIDNSSLIPGTYYYRLLTIGTEGQECMSSIITVKINDEELDSTFDIATPENEEAIPFKPNAIAVEEVLLYPNPASDYTNLQITVNELSFLEVNIFDIEGKMVLSEVVEGMINDEEATFRIPLHTLKSGIYFVRTEINDRIVVRKLVIQEVLSTR